MKVINMYSGPGAGKSTTAAGIFHKMKLMGYHCELVREVVKTPAYAERKDIFQLQGYILEMQNYEMHVLRDKVDWIITDAPLLMSSIYAKDNDTFGLYSTFEPYVRNIYSTYDNVNVFLNRVKPYQTYGRIHSEGEAIIKDHEILTYFGWHNIPYIKIDGNEAAVDFIIDTIVKGN